MTLFKKKKRAEKITDKKIYSKNNNSVDACGKTVGFLSQQCAYKDCFRKKKKSLLVRIQGGQAAP